MPDMGTLAVALVARPYRVARRAENEKLITRCADAEWRGDTTCRGSGGRRELQGGSWFKKTYFKKTWPKIGQSLQNVLGEPFP